MVEVSFAVRSPKGPASMPQRMPHRPLESHAARPATSAPRVPTERRATIEDWLQIPEEKRAELLDGRIVYHAFPDLKHGNTQARISGRLHPYDRRRTDGGGGGGAAQLGGWWLSQEVDMAIGNIGCRPDVVGWRRDKHARVPRANARGVITETPDFICEVLSPSTEAYDWGVKLEAYHRAGVPYYWLVDPTLRSFKVLEWTERGYLIVLVAAPGQTVRAAPFGEVEIPVEELFLDEEGELPAVEVVAEPAASVQPAKTSQSAASAPATPRTAPAASKTALPAPGSPKKTRAPRGPRTVR